MNDLALLRPTDIPIIMIWTCSPGYQRVKLTGGPLPTTCAFFCQISESVLESKPRSVCKPVSSLTVRPKRPKVKPFSPTKTTQTPHVKVQKVLLCGRWLQPLLLVPHVNVSPRSLRWNVRVPSALLFVPEPSPTLRWKWLNYQQHFGFSRGSRKP